MTMSEKARVLADQLSVRHLTLASVIHLLHQFTAWNHTIPSSTSSSSVADDNNRRVDASEDTSTSTVIVHRASLGCTSSELKPLVTFPTFDFSGILRLFAIVSSR
ncbi:hypothetical protein ACHAXH_008228 [Discostella pseudostelligera]